MYRRSLSSSVYALKHELEKVGMAEQNHMSNNSASAIVETHLSRPSSELELQFMKFCTKCGYYVLNILLKVLDPQ